MMVQAHCPAICAIGEQDSQCGAVIEIEVLFIARRYDWRRGLKPERVIAKVPTECPYGHTLDDATRARLEQAAIELQGVAA